MEDPIGKIPPYNDDAEAAILGAMFRSNEVVKLANQYLKADDFYKNAHKELFSLIVHISEDNKLIDIDILIEEELTIKSRLELYGGYDYIRELISRADIGKAEYYAKCVQDCSIRRQFIRICSEGISKAYSESERIQDTMRTTLKELDAFGIRAGYRY